MDGLVRLLIAQQADVLLMGGDYQEGCEYVPELFAALAKVKTPMGTYGVMGNNDYERCHEDIIREMKRYGMHVLEHKVDTLRKNGQQILNAGVRNPIDLKQNGKYLKNESKLTFADVEDCLILVSSSFSTQTSYENQTKKAITNKFVQDAMTEFFRDRLHVYFIENKQEADRIAEQVLINKHIDKMDIAAQIKKNLEKRDAKLRKQGIDPAKLNNYANMSTRNVKTSSAPAATKAKAPSMTQEQKEEAMRKATEYYNKNAAKPGSLASKANMVRDYNEKNNK